MVKIISSNQPFEPEASDLILPGVEPDFVLDKWHQLKAPRLVDQWRLISYFAHQIARQPSDLLSHTRRIIFHASLKDQEGVYGALLDLYLALGSKGSKLRQGMLEIANDFLSDDQKTLFATHQQSGILPSQALPASSTSILGNFFSGTSQLLSLDNSPVPKESDLALKESMKLLIFGKVEQAQQLLEGAVIADPLHYGLNKELLGIYRRNDSKEDFRKMRALLQGAETAIPEKWLEADKYLNRIDGR